MNVSICEDLKVTQITIPDYYFSTAQDERRARRSGIVSIAGKSVCLDCPVIAHATNDRLYFDIIPRRVDDDCLGPRPPDAKSRCRSPPPRVGRVVEPWISQYWHHWEVMAAVQWSTWCQCRSKQRERSTLCRKNTPTFSAVTRASFPRSN